MSITEKKETGLASFDLSGKLPDLHKARIIQADLTSDYWTPETEGECKLGFLQSMKNSTYTDEKTGETIELPCVIFIEQKPDGSLKTIRNGSKRLAASIEEAMKEGKIKEGSPLRIEFLGKQKNSTNQFNSDRWSVKPLAID